MRKSDLVERLRAIQPRLADFDELEDAGFEHSALLGQMVPEIINALTAAHARIDETEKHFWAIVDQNGLTGLPSDMWGALERLVRRDAAAHAEIATLRGSLSEMTRRRDEWRKKAEGFETIRRALREKIGEPPPAQMSRFLWAAVAADEKKRADDAEAEVERLRAELAGARERDAEVYSLLRRIRTWGITSSGHDGLECIENTADADAMMRRLNEAHNDDMVRARPGSLTRIRALKDTPDAV